MPAPSDAPITPRAHVHTEQRLISAAFKRVDLLPRALEIVSNGSMMFRASHATLWEAIRDLYDRGEFGGEGSGMEFLTYLDRSGMLEEAGGESYLVEVLGADAWGDELIAYAKSVRDRAARRFAVEQVARIGNDLRSPAANLADAAEALRAASRELDGESSDETTRMASLKDLRLKALWNRTQGLSGAILTPFVGLNDLTGGWMPEEVVYIAARPSVGKTAMMLQLANFAASNGHPTLLISLEMSPESIFDRLLSLRSGVSAHAIRTGKGITPEDWHAIQGAAKDIDELPLHYPIRSGRVLHQVMATIRDCHSKHGIQLVAIDYLQLIKSDNSRETEYQSISRATAELKGVAKEIRTPFLVLSQLNRDTEKRDDKRPRMSDLRGSGSIEQDGDTVIFMHRPDYYDPNDRVGETDLIVDKSRNGPVGDVTVRFAKKIMRFEDPPVTTRPEEAPY